MGVAFKILDFQSSKQYLSKDLNLKEMVSIIIAIIGFMMILSGIGLRGVLRLFGAFQAIFGLTLLSVAGLGYFLTWTNHRQLVLAGGAMLVFFFATAVWQLIEKFRPHQPNKK